MPGHPSLKRRGNLSARSSTIYDFDCLKLTRMPQGGTLTIIIIRFFPRLHPLASQGGTPTITEFPDIEEQKVPPGGFRGEAKGVSENQGLCSTKPVFLPVCSVKPVVKKTLPVPERSRRVVKFSLINSKFLNSCL
jgi:hypothetical protein